MPVSRTACRKLSFLFLLEDNADDSVLTGCTNNLGAHNDELDEYLALPQIENTTESGGEWRECSCVVIACTC